MIHPRLYIFQTDASNGSIKARCWALLNTPFHFLRDAQTMKLCVEQRQATCFDAVIRSVGLENVQPLKNC